MQRKILSAISIALILAFIAVPASASTPQEMSFTSHMTISSGSGTFDASGPAVEAGVICPQGTIADEFIRAGAYQGRTLVFLYIRKTFTCSDGSGSFIMDLKVQIFNEPNRTQAEWVVTGGDGAYARLRGAGGLYAILVDDDHLIDYYSGKLHID